MVSGHSGRIQGTVTHNCGELRSGRTKQLKDQEGQENNRRRSPRINANDSLEKDL